ncbi:MAG: cellobiose phosphorylase [Anaerolineae bacterium]|jgi:cellobiose phosphorylase
MERDRELGWTFIDEEGTFALPGAHRTSYLYFPLVNERGMVSVVTPTLHGDVKTGHDTYLTPPVSVEDLHVSRAARNIWVEVEGQVPWSATGNSAAQIARRFTPRAELVDLEAGFLWHRVARTNPTLDLRAEITSFVPPTDDAVEVMGVVLENVASQPLTLAVTAAIPIFGRSADHLRDHRHVTSLLHQVHTQAHGVLVRPTLAFDERGHHPNDVTYAVLGAEADGAPPTALFPVQEDFVGEGGTLDWPQAMIAPASSGVGAGAAIDGYEALGGLRFSPITLAPGERQTYVLILGILEDGEDPQTLVERYGSLAQFDAALERNRAYWERKLAPFRVDVGDPRFNGWMKWVALQPTLRRICGNSFLPYHDYGRGGRGWRDLWQDLLALLLLDSAPVDALLLSNFAGVRMDGSNATIIGTQPGEFKADRNDIPRVWMDHGAWPLLTTQLYIDQTGDLAFLLRDQSYFKDRWIDRAHGIDAAWEEAQGTTLRAADGTIYRGTVLEHLLVQHLTAFFNVGEHNVIRLEGADWNDGMDMAPERGESVAFTMLYAGNLRLLGALCRDLVSLGVQEVDLAAELMLLLDTLGDPLDYDRIPVKQDRLAEYFAVVGRVVSGEKVRVSLEDLARDLDSKADWLAAHLRAQEWVESAEGLGWFNGYYDNDGQRVEGEFPDGVRITLTGQTFALMGGVATEAQAAEIVRAVDRYLYDSAVGGPRLNTDFGDALRLSTRLGRCFGFAFGHKENGAMFSHMAVMYANALYQRGLARAGHRILDGIYRHSQDFSVSRMYPGIPEYVSARRRGMYPYLTGSASWYLLTMITQVFGVRGYRGDLLLDPRLVREQFDVNGRATLSTLFAGRRIEIVYHNPEALPYGEYVIREIRINGEAASFDRKDSAVLISRDRITHGRSLHLDVMLG